MNQYNEQGQKHGYWEEISPDLIPYKCCVWYNNEFFDSTKDIKYYYQDGRLYAEGNFHTKITKYSNNGTVVIDYSNNIFEGDYLTLYQKNRTETKYRVDMTLKSKFTYVDWVQSGPFSDYDEDGNIKMTGDYLVLETSFEDKYSFFDGLITSYKNGLVYSKRLYRWGTFLKIKTGSPFKAIECNSEETPLFNDDVRVDIINDSNNNPLQVINIITKEIMGNVEYDVYGNVIKYEDYLGNWYDVGNMGGSCPFKITDLYAEYRMQINLE